MKPIMIFLIMALTLALPTGGWPKAAFQHKVIHEDRNTHVFLLNGLDESNAVTVHRFEHPVALKTKEVSEILGNLRYSKKVLFKWRGDYEVFFKSEIDNLSKQLSRALQDASPTEWIEFASTVQSRDSIDPVALLTDGYVFKKDGKLHIVFLNLKSEVAKNKRPRGGDPREWFSLGFKRINYTEEMSAPPVIPGTRFFDKPHDNWVVIDAVSLLNPKKETNAKVEEPETVYQPNKIKETSAEARVPETFTRKSLVDRMRILKELFDNDLITEQEYQKKKEEILNEL